MYITMFHSTFRVRAKGVVALAPGAMIFKVPHILRCSRDDFGVFPNEGFDIVCVGAVVLSDLQLTIFETGDDVAVPSPKLVIPFARVDSVEATIFRSGQKRFKGGQIRIVGRFDRGVDERVTMQMQHEVFLKLVAALECQIHSR